MCNKCGQAYTSPYVSERTIARRQKEKENQAYWMMGLSMAGSLFNVLGQVIPSKDDDNDYNYTPRTKDKTEVEEAEEAEAVEEEITDEEFETLKKEVEAMYNVAVVDVNTMNYAGKSKSRYTKAGFVKGRTIAVKKAIVTLKEGDTIDFYSNI